MAETALIRADSLPFQAATATPVGSTAMETTETGGRLQSPVPAHGYVDWTTTTTVCTVASTIETTAFQLVASGIKILNYSDVVAQCYRYLVSVLLKSSKPFFAVTFSVVRDLKQITCSTF